jgi:glycosyltransferase involved in cell wall biosynthesis
MRRVLAISWEMPPMYGPRSAQVTRVLGGLPAHGWKSTVVCMDPRRNGPHWFDDASPVPSGVRLVRVKSPQESSIVRAAFRLVPALRDYPDPARLWVAPAVRAAVRVAHSEPHDALLTFAQPWSDHLVGLRVRRATGLPWIAHFSDPWTDSVYATRRQRAIWKPMEAAVVRDATALVFVTEETADLVMRKYPREWRSKVAIVPHGFEPAPAPTCSASTRQAGPMRMIYTGRFYRDLRTPLPLLRALALLNGRASLADSIVVSFVGPQVGDYRAEAERLGIAALVTFQDRVAASAATAAAAAADVLLVIDAPGEEPSVFLPSKLIDYLALRKIIFGITPARGASADILRRLNCPVAPPDDVDAIASAIHDLLERWRAGRLSVDASFDRIASEFDVAHTSRRLGDVLARACA